MVISHITDVKPYDKDFQEYRLSVKEFIELMAVEGENLYTRIRQACKMILKKTFSYKRKKGYLSNMFKN